MGVTLRWILAVLFVMIDKIHFGGVATFMWIGNGVNFDSDNEPSARITPLDPCAEPTGKVIVLLGPKAHWVDLRSYGWVNLIPRSFST